jgi:hypothetical protein
MRVAWGSRSGFSFTPPGSRIFQGLEIRLTDERTGAIPYPNQELPDNRGPEVTDDANESCRDATDVAKRAELRAALA